MSILNQLNIMIQIAGKAIILIVLAGVMVLLISFIIMFVRNIWRGKK